MLIFLLDENLPDSRIPAWEGPEFVHQRSIAPAGHDAGIGRYARERSLTIVTKDSDFAESALANTPPPRVVFLRLGGMRLRDMRDFLARNWPEITQLSALNKLVNVFPTFLQGIN